MEEQLNPLVTVCDPDFVLLNPWISIGLKKSGNPWSCANFWHQQKNLPGSPSRPNFAFIGRIGNPSKMFHPKADHSLFGRLDLPGTLKKTHKNVEFLPAFLPTAMDTVSWLSSLESLGCHQFSRIARDLGKKTPLVYMGVSKNRGKAPKMDGL